MSNNTAISIQNISKNYTISVGYQADTFREKLVEIVKSPFNLFGSSMKTKKKSYWALKDVSFEVKKGEVIGIVGKNGAGKSTLLKILARTTYPTTGQITFKGKVASLLEVGTGFNPELTGRENIFLNGAIIGMSQREISEKFETIVEFSGVREFLDVPVKRYSSGMYVRLAFAVAAHLEADIMLIDEVLAVGDAEFQKKCLSKMSDLAKSGRTIIFVSHNMLSVQQLCSRAILLKQGKILADGKVNKIIEEYQKEFDPTIGTSYRAKSNKFKFALIKQVNIYSTHNNYFLSDDDINIRVDLHVKKRATFLVCIMVTDMHDKAYIFSSQNDLLDPTKQKVTTYEPGDYLVNITIPAGTFLADSYKFYIQLDNPFVKNYDRTPAMRVDIIKDLEPLGIFWKGKLQVKAIPKNTWSINKSK